MSSIHPLWFFVQLIDDSVMCQYHTRTHACTHACTHPPTMHACTHPPTDPHTHRPTPTHPPTHTHTHTHTHRVHLYSTIYCACILFLSLNPKMEGITLVTLPLVVSQLGHSLYLNSTQHAKLSFYDRCLCFTNIIIMIPSTLTHISVAYTWWP